MTSFPQQCHPERGAVATRETSESYACQHPDVTRQRLARFTFKLEAVLEQRKSVERQRQRDVATAQHALLKLQAEIDALAAVSRSSAIALRSGRLSAAALAAHQRFILSMRHKAKSLKQQHAGAERELRDAQAALTEAAKQR